MIDALQLAHVGAMMACDVNVRVSSPSEICLTHGCLFCQY